MKNEIKDKWSEIITYLRDEYLINGVLFRTWIEPLEVISFQNDTLVIAINEQTQGDILDLIEKRYTKNSAKRERYSKQKSRKVPTKNI